MLYLSLQPWLDSDLAFNMTALGRENRQCVKVLHDFTNQVENLDQNFWNCWCPCSYACTDELAMSYLEIFEDDVDGAVTAFLESDPHQKLEQQAAESEEAQNFVEMPATRFHDANISCEQKTPQEGMHMSLVIAWR